MEESFESYLGNSDEDSFFSGRAKGRYDDHVRAGIGVDNIGSVDNLSFGSDGSFNVDSYGVTGGMLRTGNSAALGVGSIDGWGNSPPNIQGGDQFNFDIDLDKKKKKKKKKKKRDKEQERLERERRASKLTMSKEERMQELLGQLSTQRDSEILKKEEDKRQKEQEARLLEQQQEQAVQLSEESVSAMKSFGSLASDSLEMSSADFEVGGYQARSLREKEKEKAAREMVDAVAVDSVQKQEPYISVIPAEDTIPSLKQKLSAQLNEGVDKGELAKQFSFEDLSGLMQINTEHDADLLDGEESSKQAQEIFASIQAEASVERETDDDHSNHYESDYEEEQDDEEEQEEEEKHKASVMKPEKTFAIGMRIEAKLFEWTQFYCGKITRIHDDGLIDILFDDGERVDAVDPHLIKPLESDDTFRPETPPSSPQKSPKSHSPKKAESPVTSPLQQNRPISPAPSPPMTPNKAVDEPASPSRTPPTSPNLAPVNRVEPPSPGIPSPPKPVVVSPPPPPPPKKISPNSASRIPSPQTKAEEMRNLFWGGMAAKPSVSKSPPPPPPPTQVSPGDRLQNPTFSISVDSASGRERIIRKPLKFKTETPPPPPPTVSLSKSARQHSPTRYAGTRIGGGFHVDNVDTYKAEISRLSLLESSLRSEMHNINLEKNGWMEKAQDLERALTVKEAELYSMTAKVKELESTNAVRGSLRKILSNEDGESVIPMDQLQRIEKEMAEQEKLLAGYQHENEKLMEKLRLADKKTDQVREDMYKASMRTGFEDTKQQTPKLAGDELRRLLKAEEAVESLDKELEEQKQSNAKLKAELVELRDEKPTSSTEEALNSLRNELAEARYEHLSEAKALKEKLAWYAENQALINANEELIDKQAARISELESNLGTSPAKTGRPKVSLPQDLKRIRTLEKQVKELDEALRKRNPNCLANLILAAGPSDSEKQTRRELRQKVAELEDELEKREGRFSSRIRTLRQEHERVKVRYERLLETSKAQEENIDASNHHFSPVTDSKIASLEQELVRVRDFYRKKLEDQSKKSSMALRSAKRDGTAGLTPSLQSMQRDADKLRAAKIALEARVEELEMQLDSRGKKPVAQSNKKVEHLENKLERISNENAQLKRDMDGLLSKKQMPTRRMEGKVKDDNEDGEDSVLVEIIEQVEASESKDSKLENEEYSLQKALKKSQEERAHISKKLQQVIDENALMNTRWEQALRRSEQAVERLHVANLELEAQLQEAKKDLNTPQTPSMLQHQALARKLEDMEQKFRARERELELLVQQVKHAADIDLQTAQTKYDMVLADKDREILRFRRELDELISALQQ